MGAAILCVGVMVNLHFTLLLDRLETWCMDGDQLVCPEVCPELGWGSLWGMGQPRRGACGGLQAGYAPMATQVEALVSGIYLSSTIETL